MRTPTIATARLLSRKFILQHPRFILRHGVATLALALFFIGLTPAASLAQAQRCESQVIDPLVLGALNFCNGDPVDITARFTSVFCVRQDANGGEHVMIRLNTHGQGQTVSLTPKRYTFNNEEVQEQQLPSSGTVEETVVTNLVMIRQAEDGTTPLFSEDDMLLKVTVHVTFTPGGVPTAQPVNAHFNCQ